MSAILGVFNRDGRPICLDEITEMVAALGHRGPDGAATWADGPVGLGHLMLHTTPESLNESMPLATPGGDRLLAADVRLDNRDELIARLGLASRPPGEIGDGALLLASYERWGEACPERLLGDFSFAIWDRRRQTLFCAVDPMGVKSLYYFAGPRVFAFASEARALFSSGRVPRRLNEARVVDYLADRFEDRVSTFFEDVLRLAGGTSLSVSRSRVSLRTYWAIDTRREIRLGSDAEYAEAFREIFTKAVHSRLRSAFPIASTLSGGLDSSSIACTARSLLPESGAERLHTISAVFPSLPRRDLQLIDERPQMQRVLALGGFEPHFVHADTLSPLRDAERVHLSLDEPNFAPNLYLHWAMYETTNRLGARVLLDGFDGDSVVSHGLDHLTDLARSLRWPSLYRELQMLQRHQFAGTSRRRLLTATCLQPLTPGWLETPLRLLTGHGRTPLNDPGLVNADVERRVQLRRGRVAGSTMPGAWTSTARARHAASLSHGLYAHTLGIADKASAAFALEARYPFFDRRLVEFCVGLPPEQKLGRGWTRLVLRRAMAGIVPDEVRWRRDKANLSPNFQRQLLVRDRARLEHVILRRTPPLSPFVDERAAQEAFHRFAGSPPERAVSAESLFAAVNLALWLHQTGLAESTSEPSIQAERIHPLEPTRLRPGPFGRPCLAGTSLDGPSGVVGLKLQERR